MTQSPDHETRITRLEARMEEVAADAAAARHLAAMNDRDLADVGHKIDAHRKAIDALGQQTRGRFDHVDARFDHVDARFDRLEGRFDGLEGRFDGLEGRFDGLGGRFDGLERRVDALETAVDDGFAAMRHGFDQTAAGFARIAELIGARDDDR